MKTLHVIFFLIGCFQASVYADDPQSVDYTVVDSLFTKLTTIKNDFSNDKQEYETALTSLALSFDTLTSLEKSRTDSYNCLAATFHNLVDALNNCQTTKQAEIDRHSATMEDLQNQIDALMVGTNTEIANLQSQINSLNNDIATLNTKISTFVSMNEATVNQALQDLEQARLHYTAALNARQAFLAELAILKDKVTAYSYLANQDTATIAELICNQ